MTSGVFGGGSTYQQPTQRALSSIAKSPGLDMSSGQQEIIKLLQGDHSQIQFLATNQKQLQQGVNDATQNPIQQVQQFIADLIVLLDGGEVADGGPWQFGNLKYILPMLGALFGLGDGPFPIDLFQAAEKLFFGYVVPGAQFTDLINSFITKWAAKFGISQAFVKDITDLNTAVSDLFGGIHGLLPNVNNFFQALGITGSDLGPLGQKLAPILHVFDNIDLGPYHDITEFVTGAMGTFITHLTNVINFIDEVLRVLGADESGADVVNSPLPQLTQPFVNLVAFLGNVRLTVEDFHPLQAAQQWLARLVLPVSGLSNDQPDLQIDSGFDDFTSIADESAAWAPEGDDAAWVWDVIGNTAAGSAKVVADGSAHALLGTVIPVSADQKITVEAYVKWSSLTATGSPLALQLLTDTSAQIAIDAVASPGTTGDWTHLTGSYTVTAGDITAGVTSVQTRLLVDTSATAGSVWFDDAPIRRTNLLKQTLVENLIDDLAGLLSGESFQDFLNQIGTALGQLSTGFSPSDIAGFLQAKVQFLSNSGLFDVANFDLTNRASSILKNIDTSGLFDGAAVTGALNTALTISGNAISSLFSGSGALANMLTGALNTGVTISGNAISLLFNGSGALASALTGAMNTGVTLAGNAISSLFNSSGLIASKIAGALNPAVTFLVGASNVALSTLLGNLNATGQFVASAITGALNTAVTISGNAISSLFSGSGVLASALTGALATGVTISGNAVSTLFNSSGALASMLTGAINTGVTISGNALSALFNGSGVLASALTGALNTGVTFLVGATNVALSTLLGGFDTSGNFSAAALTGAMATGVTVVGKSISTLFNASGLIASQIAGALNTAVTISGNAISTLFSGSGALASALTGALPTGLTISGNALSGLFSASGALASALTGALPTALTISGNALSGLFSASGVLASALTGALPTALTISGNALSSLFSGSGVLASALTGAMNTGVTILGSSISTLFDGNGLIGSKISGALNTAATIAGNALSTLFDGGGLKAEMIKAATYPAFDVKGTSASGTGTSGTGATITGTAGGYVYAVITTSNAAAINAATAAGSAMTLVPGASKAMNNVGSNGSAYVYKIAATGSAQAISVTFSTSTSWVIEPFSYTGVGSEGTVGTLTGSSSTPAGAMTIAGGSASIVVVAGKANVTAVGANGNAIYGTGVGVAGTVETAVFDTTMLNKTSSTSKSYGATLASSAPWAVLQIPLFGNGAQAADSSVIPDIVLAMSSDMTNMVNAGVNAVNNTTGAVGAAIHDFENAFAKLPTAINNALGAFKTRASSDDAASALTGLNSTVQTQGQQLADLTASKSTGITISKAMQQPALTNIGGAGAYTDIFTTGVLKPSWWTLGTDVVSGITVGPGAGGDGAGFGATGGSSGSAATTMTLSGTGGSTISGAAGTFGTVSNNGTQTGLGPGSTSFDDYTFFGGGDQTSFSTTGKNPGGGGSSGQGINRFGGTAGQWSSTQIGPIKPAAASTLTGTVGAGGSGGNGLGGNGGNGAVGAAYALFRKAISATDWVARSATATLGGAAVQLYRMISGGVSNTGATSGDAQTVSGLWQYNPGGNGAGHVVFLRADSTMANFVYLLVDNSGGNTNYELGCYKAGTQRTLQTGTFTGITIPSDSFGLECDDGSSGHTNYTVQINGQDQFTYPDTSNFTATPASTLRFGGFGSSDTSVAAKLSHGALLQWTLIDSAVAAVASSNIVSADASTTSASFTTSMASGALPTETFNVPASGRVWITLTSQVWNATLALMSIGWSMTGASGTVAASDTPAASSGGSASVGVENSGHTSSFTQTATMRRLLTGLTPGSTTFAMNGKTSAGTAHYINSELTIEPA